MNGCSARRSALRFVGAALALFLFPGLGQDAWAGDQTFEPPEAPLTFRASPARHGLRIDGILDDADWATAEVITGFLQVEPAQGQPPAFDSEVRVLFDDRNLYVGVSCPDSTGITRVQNLARDFDFYNNDMFSISIDCFGTGRVATSFQVTPYGNQRDLQVFEDNIYDREWDALWDVRTQRRPDGWTAEFAIPFASLRYPSTSPGEDACWGVIFYRNLRRLNESTALPVYPRAYTTYRMTYAARLCGIQPPPAAGHARVQPYVLLQESRRDGEGGAIDRDSKVGGDVKWGVTSHGTLDATINTDFAQADVDRRVVNLSRFSVFLPERRQFFLENAGLFSTGGSDVEPFFSRTIGLDGDFGGRPIPINAGLRYTDRTLARSIGALLVHQGGRQSFGRSLFGVGRYIHNYGGQNQVGVLMTHREDEGGEATNDPTGRTAVTLTGYNRSGPLVVTSMLSYGARNRGAKDGHAASFYGGYSNNRVYLALNSALISKHYDTGMGFVSRPDLLVSSPYGYAKVRAGWFPSWLRQWDPGLGAYIYQRASDGAFQEGYLEIFPIYWTLQNGGYLSWYVIPNWQDLEDEFQPVAGASIEPGRYKYLRHRLYFQSDQSRALSWEAQLEAGGYFDGNLYTAEVSARLAPVPQAAVLGTVELNDLRGVGTGDSDASANLYTIEGRFALDPRLQLSAFYQYGDDARSGNVNVRLSWEYQPLSHLYLVFNELDNGATGAKERQFIAKVSYARPF